MGWDGIGSGRERRGRGMDGSWNGAANWLRPALKNKNNDKNNVGGHWGPVPGSKNAGGCDWEVSVLGKFSDVTVSIMVSDDELLPHVLQGSQRRRMLGREDVQSAADSHQHRRRGQSR